MAREIACLQCSAFPLTPTVQNTKARDFECLECREPYELKGTSRKLGPLIPDGEYRTFRAAVQSERVPNLLIMEYDRDRLRVRSLTAIHKRLISVQAIIPRNPLSAGARRAGWQGCNINLGLIPEPARVSIVENGFAIPWSVVTTNWARFNFMIPLKPKERSWIRDVWSIVQELSPDQFRLEDVYAHEARLAELHPSNKHIRPKIRQQLQLLVAEGTLRREGPGLYVSTSQSPAQ